MNGVIAAALWTSLLLQQAPAFVPPTRSDLLGMSPDQVIRLGRDEWTKRYDQKMGGSTASMARSQSLWADARRAINERTIKRMTPGRRQAASELRELMITFHGDTTQVGYIMSGGGTMWIVAGASGVADAEDALARMVQGRRPGRSPGFEGHMTAFKKMLDSKKKEIDEMGSAAGGYSTAAKKLSSLRVTHAKMREAAAKFIPGSSTHATVFACKSIEAVTGLFGEN